MMRKNDANHEIETPITKNQVPNKFQITISKNGKTGSRLVWDLITGTCLGLVGFDFFRITSALRPRELREDRARLDSTSRRHRPMRKPGLRLFRNKYRMDRVNRPTWHRAAR